MTTVCTALERVPGSRARIPPSVTHQTPDRAREPGISSDRVTLPPPPVRPCSDRKAHGPKGARLAVLGATVSVLIDDNVSAFRRAGT